MDTSPRDLLMANMYIEKCTLLIINENLNHPLEKLKHPIMPDTGKDTEETGTFIQGCWDIK